VTTSTDSIQLVFASGPTPVDPISLDAGTPTVLGRGSACDVTLDDQHGSVSRKHLELSKIDGRWFARDLESRNGSFLDGHRMAPNEPMSIQSGSLLQIGSWAFRVSQNNGKDIKQEHASTLVQTLDDSSDDAQLFERVHDEPLARLASHRLAVLLECSDLIHSCEDLAEASAAAIEAMLSSTGYVRGAFIRPSSQPGVFETLAFKCRAGSEDVSSVRFSQSLIEMASAGEIVRVSSSGAQRNYGQSIAELDIHSALCVPILIDGSPIGYLYLDARGSEDQVSHDASSFGRAIGRLLGLTAANLRNKELEIQRVEMQYDLDIAARAQRMLLPDSEGTVGRISYCMSMRPGRFVAGDLFGVVPLEDERICVFLGDVSGKGAGSAILMATTQSYIHAMLEQSTDLAQVMSKLNRHVADRSHGGMFVTMWIGILDPKNDEEGCKVEFIDAGHGHWLMTKEDDDVQCPEYRGCLVVGIDPNHDFRSEWIELERGQRLVLFSDGVVEQKTPKNSEEFGLDRTVQVLRGCDSSKQDVEQLATSVIAFAESEQLDDDMTIASIGVVEESSND
jgi:serine phosphatase RsbU (regulator of sigma subunit)